MLTLRGLNDAAVFKRKYVEICDFSQHVTLYLNKINSKYRLILTYLYHEFFHIFLRY